MCSLIFFQAYFELSKASILNRITLIARLQYLFMFHLLNFSVFCYVDIFCHHSQVCISLRHVKSWIKLDQTCSNLIKVDQIDLNLIKLVQTGSNLFQ